MCDPRAAGSRRAKATRQHHTRAIPSTDTRASGRRSAWSWCAPCRISEHETSWGDDLDLFGRRHCHVELCVRHAFDECVRGPGALLQLQLAPLDLEVVTARVQPFELDKHLARAMLDVDRARGRLQRSNPQNG